MICEYTTNKYDGKTYAYNAIGNATKQGPSINSPGGAINH